VIVANGIVAPLGPVIVVPEATVSGGQLVAQLPVQVLVSGRVLRVDVESHAVRHGQIHTDLGAFTGKMRLQPFQYFRIHVFCNTDNVFSSPG
jgi:hypothetical protein